MGASKLDLLPDADAFGLTDRFAVVQGAEAVTNEDALGSIKKGVFSVLVAWLAGIAATFTNKTFDAEGTGNSLTNVKNSNIKAAAAIDATKIAGGTVDNTEFGYLNGVTSALQTQLDAKLASMPLYKLTANTTINDDAALDITLPSGGAGFVFIFGTVRARGFAIVGIRAASTPTIDLVASFGATVGVGTAALAGTTGADGQLNVAALSTGHFHIENRTGANGVYTAFMFANQ